MVGAIVQTNDVHYIRVIPFLSNRNAGGHSPFRQIERIDGYWYPGSDLEVGKVCTTIDNWVLVYCEAKAGKKGQKKKRWSRLGARIRPTANSLHPIGPQGKGYQAFFTTPGQAHVAPPAANAAGDSS
jgi:hypothetical protein